MQKLILLFLALTPIWAAGNRPVSVGDSDKIIPHIAFGGSWSTTITLINTYNPPDGHSGMFELRFYGDDGAELTVPVLGFGNVHVLSGNILYGGSRTIELASSSPDVITGWAKLNFNVYQKAVIAGMAVFRQTVPGRPDLEAVVPMSTEGEEHYVMPFNHRNGFKSGLALCNTSDMPASVDLTFKNEEGQPIGSPVTITLPSKGHISYEVMKPEQLRSALTTPLAQYPQLVNWKGTIHFSFSSSSSLGKINALGLRFNLTNSFTSVHSLEMYN